MRHRLALWLIAVILAPASVQAFADADASPEPKKTQKPDAAKLAQQLKEAQARIDQLTKEVQAQRDKAVAAEIQAQALKERVETLMKQVEKLTRQLARQKGGKGAAAGNAPAEDVEGLVKEVKDGKVRISIGSDAGLTKGHTLEVFRLKPAAKYLGRLRVVEVKATEAIGQMMGGKTEVQKGDTVASRMKVR
jgi:hypothetical protein